MKNEYPSYEKGDTNILEKNLKGKDKEVFEKFMTFVSANAGKQKQMDRRKDILQIHDVMEKPFDSWDYNDLTGFISILNKDSRKVWTKKGILITLTIFLRWQYDDWFVRFKNLDLIKKLQRQLKPNTNEKYNKDTMPTAEELDKMIRSASKIWHKLWISMVAEAGTPFAVQSKLTWKDVDIDMPEDGITTLKYFREKNDHDFIFPLGKTTTYYLKQWQQEYPYPDIKKSDLIFPSPTDREEPIRQSSIHTMLNVIAKKAGIDKKIYQYLIRHHVLSDSYAKMSEEVHRKLYGHKPGSKMTAFYSHQDSDDTLKKALELLHKVKPLSKEEKNRITQLELKIKKLEKNLEISSAQSERAINLLEKLIKKGAIKKVEGWESK